jgi:hypothetical protein
MRKGDNLRAPLTPRAIATHSLQHTREAVPLRLTRYAAEGHIKMQSLFATTWLALVLLPATEAHPSRLATPLPSSKCQDKERVTFFSFHVHVVFTHEKSDEALRLQQGFAREFGISSEVVFVFSL